MEFFEESTHKYNMQSLCNLRISLFMCGIFNLASEGLRADFSFKPVKYSSCTGCTFRKMSTRMISHQ